MTIEIYENDSYSRILQKLVEALQKEDNLTESEIEEEFISLLTNKLYKSSIA